MDTHRGRLIVEHGLVKALAGLRIFGVTLRGGELEDQGFLQTLEELLRWEGVTTRMWETRC